MGPRLLLLIGLTGFAASLPGWDALLFEHLAFSQPAVLLNLFLHKLRQLLF